MSRDRETPGNTTCSKGHIHPPWNTTGVLRIAKCETSCGFCQKETKTAANLRKHVMIHIKNAGLNLIIAEGSSGRGRLEMPTRSASTSRHSPPHPSAEDIQSPARPRSYNHALAHHSQRERFSPSTALGPMASTDHYSSSSTSPSRFSYPSTTPSYPSTTSSSPSNYLAPYNHTSASASSYNYNPPSALPPLPPSTSTSPSPNFHHRTTLSPLRHHSLPTKPAWTPIPSTEGLRILDYCKAASAASSSSTVPCYNRETLFDEEWQSHMKDVHGVFLLWPETWMRRIEVLDLDAFGGDIGVCNDAIMES